MEAGTEDHAATEPGPPGIDRAAVERALGTEVRELSFAPFDERVIA